MPPYGLYPIPRHHLYSGRTKAKIYNTNDFMDDSNDAVPSAAAMSTSKNSSAAQAIGSCADSKKETTGTKKDKKRLFSLNGDKNAELERLLDRVEGTTNKEALSKSKKDKKHKKHRRSEELAYSPGSASHVALTPHAANQNVDKNISGEERRAEKKRKRHSEAHASATSAQLAREEYLAGQRLASLARTSSSRRQPGQGAQAVDRPSKKKSKRTSQSVPQNTAGHTCSTQASDCDQPREHKTIYKAATVESGSSEATARYSSSTLPLPVPRDWTDGSDEVKVKQHKKNQEAKVLFGTPIATTPTVRVAKQTPIPFPQLRASLVKPDSTQAHMDRGDAPSRFNVLVPETPPSKTPARTPIPLPSNVRGRNDTVIAAHSPPKEISQTGLLSSPTPLGSVPALLPAPAALGSFQDIPQLPSVPSALTDANLRTFKRPLADEPKPRPRNKTGTSTVISIPTSSSLSIVEAFARVGKPLVRLVPEKDPFITAGDRSKAALEPGNSFDVFTEKYSEVAQIVDFNKEDQYLEDHLEWDATRQDPAPCLHKMTGCSAKKEELIRMSRDENMQILAQLDTPTEDVAKLEEASNQSQRAEDLLMLATKARLPVPIGIIEGKWTLYSPKYAENHFDRYGYGQRSLVISPIAGFKFKDTFTARMQIPPRTMAFSILAFQIPPHASFRTITIKTASEGYTMDVVFLGNGFMHLRADLGRLLTGTYRKPDGDSHVMEFIGVHEKATQWWSFKTGQGEAHADMFPHHDGNVAGV